MAHSRLEVGSYTVEFHGDKKYAVKWDMELLGNGIQPMDNNQRTVIGEAGLNHLQIDVHGQIISSELVGKTADKYIFDTIIPALNLFGNDTTGTLTLELNGGQLVATGWVTNAIFDRFVEMGIEMIDFSFTFILSDPATHSGLS